MSERIQAAIKIQSLVRGWLCRRTIGRRSRCLEYRIKSILPNRKPPVYRKRSKSKFKSFSEKKIILIQKSIRGYLQRKKYKDLLIEKMLKEQDDHWRKQIESIENEINGSKVITPKKPSKSNLLYLELPLPMSQKRSPSKYKGLNRPILFEYDFFIIAAIEIQRIFRGFLTRKKVGNFKVLRRKIIKIQKLYKSWREKKDGQLELAAKLMNKQCSMLSTSFSSYQHLKSLILTQDRQGKYTKFISHCEDKLNKSGINTSIMIQKCLEDRIKELEQEKHDQETNFKEIMNFTKTKYKGIISEYLKGVKALKFGMELAQKSNFDQISRIVKTLAGASRDLENESFYENSTFLPDVSFIERSINII